MWCSQLLQFAKSSNNIEFPSRCVVANELLIGHCPSKDKHQLHPTWSALNSGYCAERKFHEDFIQLCPGAASPQTLSVCISLLVTGLLSNMPEQYGNPLSTQEMCSAQACVVSAHGSTLTHGEWKPINIWIHKYIDIAKHIHTYILFLFVHQVNSWWLSSCGS